MSEKLEQYVYNDKVFMVGSSPITLKPTGKFPVVAEHQWKTYDDLKAYVDEPTSNAIPGMVVTVVSDPDVEKNGVYFVECVGEVSDSGDVKEGKVSKIADQQSLSSDVSELKSEIEDSKLFHSKAEDNWLTEKVGGVDGGLNRDDFEGKSICDILDDILYPTLQPTITQPSIGLSYSGQTLISVGTILPIVNNFSISTDRGSVTYTNADGNKYYAGDVNLESQSLTMSPNMFGQPSTEGTYTVTYKVKFYDGPALLDNKGKPSTKGSYVSGTQEYTKSITIKSVYQIYVNTSNINTMTSQGLKDYIAGVTLYFDIPEETDDKKFEIHVPTSTKITSVKQLNKISGNYDIPITMYQKTDMPINEKTHDGVVYDAYVRSLITDGSDNKGNSSYQVTINRK